MPISPTFQIFPSSKQIDDAFSWKCNQKILLQLGLKENFKTHPQERSFLQFSLHFLGSQTDLMTYVHGHSPEEVEPTNHFPSGIKNRKINKAKHKTQNANFQKFTTFPQQPNRFNDANLFPGNVPKDGEPRKHISGREGEIRPGELDSETLSGQLGG